MFRMIAASWVTGWIVATASDVGEKYNAGTYSVGMPLAMFGLIAISMLLGAAAWDEWKNG